MGAVRKPTTGPSRSDSDWRADKALKKCAGLIIACTSSTMPDLRSEVFGLPLNIGESFQGVRKGIPLFLLNSTDRQLYGIFEAAGSGGIRLDANTRENIDSSNVGRVVTLPHIQARLCPGAVVSALDEEKFRPVLGNGNDQKFRRIDLTQHQVQRLSSLFESHSSVERKQSVICKNRNSQVSPTARYNRNSSLPKAADKSDFEYSSDSSSRGSGEDEWIDDVKMSTRDQRDNEESLTEKLYQVALNDPQSSKTRHSKRDEHISNQSSRLIDNSHMLSRLHDNDPAVSSSNGNAPNSVDGMSPVNTHDTFAAASVVQPPVVQDEIAFVVADQAALPQRRNGPKYGQGRWSEQKSFRGSGSFYKQGFVHDRNHRSKDGRHRRQQVGSQSHPYVVRFRPQNWFLNPLQMPDQVHGQDHLPSLSAYMQPHSDIHRLPSLYPLFINPEYLEALHKEILQFSRLTRPSAEVQLPVEAAIDCVRQGLKTIWPDADVEVFGSFSTGLCLQHSDVDLVVVDAPRARFPESLPAAQVSAALIRELAAELRRHEWCESINPLENASMPVLKCLCRPSGVGSGASISVDITIGRGDGNNPASQSHEKGDKSPRMNLTNYHTGSAARDYVLRKIRELPALAPLVLLLKSYLNHKGLSNVYSGGLGSFSLTLLVIFYLESFSITDGSTPSWPTSPTSTAVSSPLFSSPECSDDSDTPSSSCNDGLNLLSAIDNSDSLGQRYVRVAASTIEKTLSFWEKGGNSNLAKLLIGFLQSFGYELDLSCEKIVLKGLDGSLGGRFKRIDRHCALWIDDPLRPGVNVGAGSFGMVHVQNAFREMLQVILDRAAPFTVLHCERSDCQDLTVLHQLSHLSRLVVAEKDISH